jgi:hypothetical protein
MLISGTAEALDAVELQKKTDELLIEPSEHCAGQIASSYSIGTIEFPLLRQSSSFERRQMECQLK